MKSNKEFLLTITLVLMSVCFVSAAPTVTDPTLDTANDLMDTGGGTLFYCASDGNKDAGGGGPWTVYAGPNLYDNDTGTYGTCLIHAIYPAPALVGVHNMSEAHALGGFAITTGTSQSWEDGYDFKIQGSNNTSNGYDGDWTDIFSFTGEIINSKTARWNSTDNVFLSSESFTSFRFAESDNACPYAEVEFFAVPPPPGSVFRFL